MKMTKINQEKVLEILTKTISGVEGKNFILKKINLYSPYYKIFGNNFYIGTLFIIGNDNYIKELEKSNLNYSSQDDREPSALSFRGTANYFDFKDYDKYQSVVFRTSKKINYYDFQYLIGKGYAKFPYLDIATEFIDNYQNAETVDKEEIANIILTDLRRNSNVHDQIPNKVLSRNLIGRLNGYR